MKKLHFSITLLVMLFAVTSTSLAQTRGYYNAPYTRYEADAGTFGGSADSISSFKQEDIAFEASDRTCVKMGNTGSVEWNIGQKFKGMVVRYSVEINTGDIGNHFQNVSGSFGVYINGSKVTTINVDTYYSWEMLSRNGNENNDNITNNNWRMRFDETRHLFSEAYNAGTKLKLVRESGNLYIDYVEVEDVPDPVTLAQVQAEYGADNVAAFQGGNGLQSFLDARVGKVIYIPAGTHNVDRDLWVPGDSTKLVGAGMWYSQINFTSKNINSGGVHLTNAAQDVKGLYLTTDNNQRAGYKGIWGTTRDATIENVWAVHFECGVWMGKYGTESVNESSNVTFRHCRFRNNYADGINLCKGSNNCVVEYCSFRNNGDDDMAVWPANSQQCHSNTFQYNTAENCWRASSCALYGGYGNKWKNIVVKDNYEVGIRVNGKFQGACFDDGAQNEFTNIDVIGCGTWRNTYNNVDAAVDITTAANCDDVRNIKFSCINITNSNSDAIQFRNDGGNQIRNVSLEGITINGTSINGYTNNADWGQPCGIRFVNIQEGINNVQYCNLTFSNITGADIATWQKPSASRWIEKTSNCAVCQTIAVTGVTVNPTSKTISIGESFTITPTVAPSDASNKNVTWSSNSTGVATVSTNGVVEGKAEGEAVITVTTADGNKTARCTVMVQHVDVTGVTLADVTVSAGTSATLSPAITPANATNKGVSYNIVEGAGNITLSNGIVTGVNPGTTAVVEVTTADGNKKARCTVTVTAEPPCQGPIIAKTTTPPVIDGNWDAGLWNNSNTFWLTNRVLDQNQGNVNGFNTKWKGLYDNNNLYLLIEAVKPAAYGMVSRNPNEDTYWQGCDAIELFFDANQSAGASYDGTDDSQYIFSYNPNDSKGASLRTGGIASATGVEYKMLVKSVNAQGHYTLEVKIPLTNLKATAKTQINMDVAVNVSKENSETGRVAQYCTFSTNDDNYKNPANFGTVELKECSSIIVGEPDFPVSDGKTITAYGNTIEVKGLIAGETIHVYNVIGTMVHSLRAENSTEYITSLNAGIYVVTIQQAGVSKKVFFKLK